LRLSINNGRSPFSEAESWKSIAATWKQLYGGFSTVGLSFEWHEFRLERPFEWGSTFHPDSLELCLNLEGRGSVKAQDEIAEVEEMTAVFYATGKRGLEATRDPSGLHRFITIEFSRSFLERHLPADAKGMHSVVSRFLKGDDKADISGVQPLSRAQVEFIRTLRLPPVFVWAQVPWYIGKALELAALYFFQPAEQEELFCRRQNVIAQSRVEKVRKIIRDNLATPPTLQEIARQVGCSPFYLSRTFSKETGNTIPQHIRQLRMERAAELLKSGKFNVTEAALEVGYSSLSHFSQAFHDTFGCCPGLYPLSFPIKQP
jgi:AraC-like DNA-binding protein